MPISMLYNLCAFRELSLVEQGKENGKIGWWFRKNKEMPVLIFLSEDEISNAVKKKDPTRC